MLSCICLSSAGATITLDSSVFALVISFIISSNPFFFFFELASVISVFSVVDIVFDSSAFKVVETLEVVVVITAVLLTGTSSSK